MTLVTIRKIQSLLIRLVLILIGKMKDESEGKIIDESVGLQSKMYSMKHIDGRESNIAKGVNIATEFNEFKDTLFNKKIEVKKIK